MDVSGGLKSYLNNFILVGEKTSQSAETALSELVKLLEKEKDDISPVFMLREILNLSDEELLLTAQALESILKRGEELSFSSYAKSCEELGKELYTELPKTLCFGDRGLRVRNVVRDFLLMREPELPKGAELVFCEEEEVFHGKRELEEIVNFLTDYNKSEELRPAAVLLTGAEGSGRSFILRQAAYSTGCNILKLDAENLSDEDFPEIVLASDLYNAVPYFPHYKAHSRWATRILERSSNVIFASAEDEESMGERIIFRREIKDITPEERSSMMKSFFPKAGLTEEELKKLSGLYLLTPNELLKCRKRFDAEIFGSSEENIKSKLVSVLQEEDTPGFSKGAQRLKTNKTLEDIVLPKEQKKTLETICSFAKGSRKVYKDWGFETKIPYGRGLSVLFYGSSGTGKTLAATAIANELELPLYRVDLSQLTSKYIGETQKNIGKIFEEAEKSGCILFFDEADALFSRRSEGSDAQDKYSNGEIAYLLQRTEEYEGITILATNLLQNFDEAFRRRIIFMVRFPLPDASLRKELWEKIFPENAPLGFIDFDLLAESFEISGAGIKNCAVYAAFLAGNEDSPIEMRHIVAAVANEYEKIGKTVNPKLLQLFT